MKLIEVRASVLRRIGALLVDLAILDILVYLNLRAFFPSTFEATLRLVQRGGDMTAMTVGLLIATLYTLAYFVALEQGNGRTLGQQLLRIRVVAPKDATFRHHLINNLFLIPFFPFTLLWFIDPLYMLYRGERFLEHLSGIRTVQVVTAP